MEWSEKSMLSGMWIFEDKSAWDFFTFTYANHVVSIKKRLISIEVTYIIILNGLMFIELICIVWYMSMRLTSAFCPELKEMSWLETFKNYLN